MALPRSTTLGLVFFASGFAGLIYESIWTHYLKLFLGHAAHAQALVLAIYEGLLDTLEPLSLRLVLEDMLMRYARAIAGARG